MSLLHSEQMVEAERAVLGSVLVEDKVMDDIGSLLEPRDFYVHGHQLIWKAMKYMHEQYKAIDLVTLSDMLLTYKRLDEVGGVDYLTGLINSTPTSANARHYAEIVRRNAIKRRALAVSEKIKRIAEEAEDIERMFDSIENLAGSIRPGITADLVHASEAEKDYFEYLAHKEDLIMTGFKRFDEWMGGLGRGWLYVLAARPSVGKTAKMLQMVRGIAAQGKGSCLVWSQEMQRNQLYNRMLAAMTGIPANKFRLKRLEPRDMPDVRRAYEELKKLPIHIADTKNVSIEEIRATARQAKRKLGPIAAIFIDYLGIMNIPQPNGMTRAQAIGETTKAAKRLAMEVDCPIILLAQMSREGKKAVKPSLEHLRESGDIEQDADVVEFLWEDPEDNDPGPRNTGAKVVKSVIAKGRDIGVNEFRYIFKGWLQRFEEADR